MTDDLRAFSGAAERNRDAILTVLQGLLPTVGTMLEIASGTGQHAAHFAAALPGWRWCPSDAQAESLPSITAWCAGLANVAPPFVLDVLADPWPGAPGSVDAIFCANMLHISPWATCAALMRGAARHLADGGLLLVYGPFDIDGEALAPSNAAFDADLRRRHAAWGLRKLSAVCEQAHACGLRLRERVPMPANNQVLVFARAAGATASASA